jgi:uncharacterized protein YqgC (DUF456 family)
MAILLLGLVLFVSLILIPIGLPGTWIMVAAALIYQIMVPGSGIGLVTVVGTTVLAVIAEVLEFTMSASYTKKYGGSRRAAWGAIIGGLVGAFMGVPVPIIGSVIGAFLGSFVGALVFELSRGSSGGAATKVAWGALLGRAVSAAMKVGVGVGIAAWVLIAAVVG